MLQRLLLIGLAVVCVTGFVACGDDQPTDSRPEEPGEIWPVAVGNRWDYRVYEFPDSGDPFSYLSSVTILGTDTTDNVISYVAGSQDHFLNQSNGLWYLPAAGGNWSLLFKYPASVNDLWISGGSGEYAVGLLSKGAKVQTPYGDFTCYKYVREYLYGGQGAVYYYLVPEVGLVAYEHLDVTNSRMERQGQLVDMFLVE